MAFDSLEPFGEARADLRAGIIAATMANHSMSPPKEPRRPIDYMLFAKRPEVKPILLADKKAQSNLLKQVLFGKKD